jgi:hypothetical protein
MRNSNKITKHGKKKNDKYEIGNILFRPFAFIASKTLNYLAFQYFDCKMKIIPE